MKISWNSAADNGVGPDLTSFKSVPILDFSKFLHPTTNRFDTYFKERKKLAKFIDSLRLRVAVSSHLFGIFGENNRTGTKTVTLMKN